MSFPIAVNLEWEELMSQSATQKLPLGTVGRMLDGRSARYAKNGATALRAGCVVQGVAPQAWSAGGTSGPLALESGTTQTSTWKTLQLETTFTTLIAKDYFKDGWLYVSSTGHVATCGQPLQIKSSKAHTASSTLLELTLMDGQHLIATLNTSDNSFGIMRNPYDSVIVVTQGAAPTAVVLGVPPMAITASYYFWVQTWGLAPVEASTALSAYGSGVVYSTDAANTGVDDMYASTGILGFDSIGTIVAGSVAGAYVMVDLKIAP